MTAMRIEPAGACNGPLSHWRTRGHWHTVWPEGGTWCYPTAEAAAARAVEVTQLRAFPEALEQIVTAILEAAPSVNAELRHDGTSDPGMSAYVEGYRDALAAARPAR